MVFEKLRKFTERWKKPETEEEKRNPGKKDLEEKKKL